ncbi:hypothetical protein HDZ31DRAFT_37209 [Schizophyllum fasciatum]
MNPEIILCDDVRNVYKCPLSGATGKLGVCRPISYEVAEGNEQQVARMEWVFGLPRGGLWYWLRSSENAVRFRPDICDLYCQGHFVLVPTFKEYVAAMQFMDNAGIKNREDSDRSMRRPLSALARPDGLYRYVFIPITERGRALQDKFAMQQQTDDDLNGGVIPFNGEACLPKSKVFPVIECYAHPYSVSVFAGQVLDAVESTMLRGQWLALVNNLTRKWRRAILIPPPQWFVEEERYNCDDSMMSSTEATGYDPLGLFPAFTPVPAPELVLADNTIDDDDYRKKVCRWFAKIDPKAKPAREALRKPVKPRRSRRLMEKASSYPPPSPHESENESDYPLSPVRRGPLRPRDPIRHPPTWTRRNGRFPTCRFTSNDWAYFRYHVALARSTANRKS